MLAFFIRIVFMLFFTSIRFLKDDAHVSTASVTTQLQTNVAANPLIVDFSTDNSVRLPEIMKLKVCGTVNKAITFYHVPFLGTFTVSKVICRSW
jgi:hypothetical protein